jgi:hypothetical protein
MLAPRSALEVASVREEETRKVPKMGAYEKIRAVLADMPCRGKGQVQLSRTVKVEKEQNGWKNWRE